MHIQEEFPDHNGFEENRDYVLRASIGKGAFGECFLAFELPYDKEREFCVKKVTFRLFRTLPLLCSIERFSLDCRKTKTKVNTLANQRA